MNSLIALVFLAAVAFVDVDAKPAFGIARNVKSDVLALGRPAATGNSAQFTDNGGNTKIPTGK